MSQFVTVQVGQCGNQIGSAFWPLALHEYGIETPNGNVNLLRTQRNHVKHVSDLSDAFSSFFYVPGSAHEFGFKTVADLSRAKAKARAVLIDMEDSVVSRFKQGSLRSLFDQTCTVVNYPGSGNNWAVGYYVHGAEYQDKLEDCVRHAAEKCDQLHGFLLMHSLGGGTGSGLGTMTLKLIAENYPRVDRLVSCVYPTATQDVVTAPYNALLATRELIDHATCVFPIENKCLLDLCKAQTNKKENVDQANYNATCRPFQDMNSIVVNMLLHLTSGSRFPGSLNMDMNEISTNLVAYPKLHYIFSSVSPVTLTTSSTAATHKAKLYDELFAEAWSRNSQLIKSDPLHPSSTVLSAAHVMRGSSSISDIKRNIERFQSKAKFTSWSGDAMKIGLCSVPPAGHSVSLMCLLNSTAMSGLFASVLSQFNTLYRRKAHVHHYTKVDGFEESHFLDCRETLTNLCTQYEQLQSQKRIDIPRLHVM